MVLAYLMQYHHLSLEQAYDVVHSKRGFVSLHPKQRKVLMAFADQMEIETEQ